MDITVDGRGSAAGTAVSRHILLTDIYRSSRLSEQNPQHYPEALDAYGAAVEQAARACDGWIYKQTGDGYLVFFGQADACLECAVQLQCEFSKFKSFADGSPFLVRVVAHGGALRSAGGEYYGAALNRVSRICQVCHPGQVLVSAKVLSQLTGELPAAVRLQDLGEHHLRDLTDPEHLYQLDHDEFARRSFPPLPTLGNRPNNLAEQPNAFIGRERELAELKVLLLGRRRLVTIIAPGGYGKSRLTVQLCADMLEDFQRGVFFVDLEPLREHTEIPVALAGALGFQFFGSRAPEQQLIDFLRDKEALLCFDNFEHVMAGAAFIGEILKEAPRVKIVVTSREPLRRTGEQVYPLDPLPLLDSEAHFGAFSDAEMLFVDRAVLANPGLSLAADSGPLVRKICHKLNGIPLAIELAAAWLDTFTLTELLGELDQQLEMTARLTDVAARHRSLRASLDWSWNLLSESQKLVLMQLSTFRGGCFAAAGAAVIGTAPREVRRQLSAIADKSWLFMRNVAGQSRFFLRDAVSREYAFEKLAESRGIGPGNVYEQAVLAHARYFSLLMEQEGQRLRGPEQLAARQRIGEELLNIYEALDTLLSRLKRREDEPAVTELLLPIARWLWLYLDMTSASREQVVRYQDLRAAVSEAGHLAAVEFWALVGCGRGLWKLGDYEQAAAALSAACELGEKLDDSSTVAIALNNLGLVRFFQGQPEAASDLHKRALALQRIAGDQIGIAGSLNNLAMVEYSRNDSDAAHQLSAEALRLFRQVGYLFGTAATLNNLGAIEQRRGNLESADQLFAEALAITRQLDARYGIAMSLTNLGDLDCKQNDYYSARARFTEALVICREIGDRDGICSALVSAGCLLAAGGHPTAGAVCLWGAQHHVGILGLALDTGDSGQIAQGLAAIDDAQTGLPASERASLKARAAAMSLDELVEQALQALGGLELD